MADQSGSGAARPDNSAPDNPEPDNTGLLAALSAIAERGAIGERSLPVAISHAEQYVRLLPGTPCRVVDLGSGGGLPGLVIAVRCPWVSLTLVERRTRRADLLHRAVVALGLQAQVIVRGVDVRRVAADEAGQFDYVTARSFAAPPVTARWASALLRPGGVLLVSEPPADDPHRWPPEMLERESLADLGVEGGIRRFSRR